MTEQIKKTVLKVLAETAPEMEPNRLDPDKAFRDQWDFDSVDHLNFILGLQKEWDIIIPEMDYPRCSNLNGCAAYLQERLDNGDETTG